MDVDITGSSEDAPSVDAVADSSLEPEVAGSGVTDDSSSLMGTAADVVVVRGCSCLVAEAVKCAAGGTLKLLLKLLNAGHLGVVVPCECVRHLRINQMMAMMGII